jgi:hypothetical protein
VGQRIALPAALLQVVLITVQNRRLVTENGALWKRAVTPFQRFIVPTFAPPSVGARRIVVGWDGTGGHKQVCYSPPLVLGVKPLSVHGLKLFTLVPSGSADHPPVAGVSLDRDSSPRGWVVLHHHPRYPMLVPSHRRLDHWYRAQIVPTT